MRQTFQVTAEFLERIPNIEQVFMRARTATVRQMRRLIDNTSRLIAMMDRVLEVGGRPTESNGV